MNTIDETIQLLETALVEKNWELVVLAIQALDELLYDEAGDLDENGL
jgi:hypothetical protein